MAIVAHTTYSDHGDCGRVNNYLCDGHGLPQADRTNRYISDGHGGQHRCMGHLCPSDPGLATAYMDRIRWNYERQHHINPNRKKGSVTHVQFYVSPSEEDHVPPVERMEMTRELIERTVLKDFPSIYIPHDNTDIQHCHISVCPYSVDGSHKLGVNNSLLYDLRREMDRICYEHGYSIIECPELWGDRAYKDWFFQVKEEGKIAIHPPKNRSRSLRKMPGKRARDRDHSNRAKAARQKAQEAYYKEVTAEYRPEHHDCFYISPHLYHPLRPQNPLCINRLKRDGTLRSDLEMHAASIGVWANHCGRELGKRKIPGTEKLRSRMKEIAGKAFEAKSLMEELDIRTHEELILHIKEVGRDIGALKQYIQRLDHKLKEGAEDDLDRVRKEKSEALLEERSREYRRLKEAEMNLHPASSMDAWEQYLSKLFAQNINQCVRQAGAEDLEMAIYELGDLLGIGDDVMRQYVAAAEDFAGYLRMDAFCKEEHWSYLRHMASAKAKKRAAFREYHEYIGYSEELLALRRDLSGFGLLGFLLGLFVEVLAETARSITKTNLTIALWDARIEKYYALFRAARNLTKIKQCREAVAEYKREQGSAAKRISQMITQSCGQSEEERCKILKPTLEKEKKQR